MGQARVYLFLARFAMCRTLNAVRANRLRSCPRRECYRPIVSVPGRYPESDDIALDIAIATPILQVGEPSRSSGDLECELNVMDASVRLAGCQGSEIWPESVAVYRRVVPFNANNAFPTLQEKPFA